MIRVTIELIPHGLEAGKSHLGTIVIANDGTGTFTRGNYTARLSMKGRPESVWKLATVTGFPRRVLGGYDLIYRALREAVGGRNP